MNKNITGAELEIMQILWREERALTLAELRDELTRSKLWNKSTVQTLVLRLRDKGVIAPLDKYGPAEYEALVTEDEYLLAEERAVLEKFGSGKRLAIAMVRNGHLSDSDIDELRSFFTTGGETK
ncbi:MAG: BlaI/MecI/CopY family transcriptional regulator [Oscillospiraceae bacterium]|jgi:predicted transcriptional regulator|nr:BlaI/MecI/CopY family transcriptional regulator [Oscillospiraceae bacterium]